MFSNTLIVMFPTTNTDIDCELYYDLIAEQKIDCEQSLFNFFIHSWAVLEPQTPYKDNFHVGLICEYLEAVYAREITKLIINIPPRYLKSMICTVTFPAWVWLKEPWHKFISTSYAENLSSDLSYKRRQLIESNWFKSLWGDKVEMQKDQNQKTFYENTQGGYMFSTSTGGTVTGKGCNTMIIDDPTKPIEAVSDVMRVKAIDFWRGTLSSRFNDPKNYGVVCVMQRLHEEDLAGYLLEKEKGWESLVIPNICEERTIYTYPKTGRVKIYEPGELLHPDREGQEELDQQKIRLGSYQFSAQRQQKPAPTEGGLVKKNWFKYYSVLPDHFEFITISMDAAFKDLETSDFVVLQAWGQLGANHYLLGQIRNKLSFTNSIVAIENMVQRYPAYNEMLIEEKANGAAIIDTLKQKIGQIIPINPKESKIARLNACAPMIESGNVYLPDPQFYPWVDDLVLEAINFPKAKNDDQVDALTQYLNRVRERNVGKISLESMRDYESSGTIAGSLTGSMDW